MFDPPEPMPDYSAEGKASDKGGDKEEPLKHLPALLPRVSVKKIRADSLAALQEMGKPSPVEFMVNLYCDDNIPRAERMDAAKAAAPYLHHKLSAVDVTTTNNTSHEDALDDLEAEYKEMGEAL